MTPTAAIVGFDSARFPGSLVPTIRSGTFRFAERTFYTLEYEGPYNDASRWGQLFPRGAIYSIVGLTGFFWVEETTVEPNTRTGATALVRTTFTWLGSVPPPQWSITPFEINPQIYRNPLFSSLTPEDVQTVYSQYQAQTYQLKVQLDAAVASNPNATLMGSLFDKLIRGFQTWYLVGIKYVWTQHYTTWSGPTLMGGFRELPWESVSGIGPGAIFCPHGTWSYLREADEMVWSNGLYTVTRTWMGAPDGFWDPDIYPATPQ